MAGYIARQSLISMGRSAAEFWPEGFELASAFQQRIVRGDWAGDAWEQISRAAAQGLDGLILDFMDERFGIYRLRLGSVVTRSIDMMGTSLEDVAAAGELWDFGSDLHLRAWGREVKSFAQKLEGAGLLEKTVVLRVPWASRTEEGQETPAPLGLTSERANELYESYYALAAEAGLRIIDLSDFPVFAEPLHQWGLAPYHYTLEVYEEIAGQLRTFLGISA